MSVEIQARLCLACGADISDRGTRAKRCVRCAKNHEYSNSNKKPRLDQHTGLRVHKTETQISQCIDCIYYDSHTECCGYALLTGHTRLGLHKGENVDINNPCKEYVARRKAGVKRGVV